MSSMMVLATLLFSLAVALAMPAADQVKPVPTLPGTCPDFKGVIPSDGTKIAGEWHGVYVMINGFEMKGTIKCVKETVISKPDGQFEAVLSAMKDGKRKSKTIYATPIAGQTGAFTLKMDKADTKMSKTGTLLSFGENFMADVICATDGTNHGYKVTVYSHEPSLDAASKDQVTAALKAANIPGELKAIDGC